MTKTIELQPLEWRREVIEGTDFAVGFTKLSKFVILITSNRMNKHKWFNYEKNARKFVLRYVKKHPETIIIKNDFWIGKYIINELSGFKEGAK